MSEDRLAAWRNVHVGFVFQTFNLIPVLTAFENVELPLLLTKLSSQERKEHVLAALKLVGLEELAFTTFPGSSLAVRNKGWPSRAPSLPIPR